MTRPPFTPPKPKPVAISSCRPSAASRPSSFHPKTPPPRSPPPAPSAPPRPAWRASASSAPPPRHWQCCAAATAKGCSCRRGARWRCNRFCVTGSAGWTRPQTSASWSMLTLIRSSEPTPPSPSRSSCPPPPAAPPAARRRFPPARRYTAARPIAPPALPWPARVRR